MKKFAVLICFSVLLISCSVHQDRGQHDIKKLSDLILNNSAIKSRLDEVFDIERNKSEIFKIVVSRRNAFVRLSIFRIIDSADLRESPTSLFKYKSNIFLCYTGAELIYGDHEGSLVIDSIKNRLTSAAINDSRVLQFDLHPDHTITFNTPPVNPFDIFESKTNEFPLNRKK